MKKIFAFIFHPLWLLLIGLLLFAVLVWWFGPLVSVGTWQPLVSELSRALLIGVVLLLVIARMAWRRWRAKRAARQLMDGMMQNAPASASDGKGAPKVAGEADVLAGRFAEALTSLRDIRLSAAGKKPGWRDWFSLGSKSYLYELPWYVFIGAPGSGKTTALVNSGLNFPLAEKFGSAAVRGIGGTRNCDWWFTDEAVLLDTAGRYTTQDSDQQADKSAWDSFLALLKKTRPRRPLNGVFLTLSVPDLIQLRPEQRSELATSLRRRLHELQATLGVRLPVYVLVTKTDLLNGFVEYFAEFGKDQRAQVWGFTLPQEGPGTAPLGASVQRELRRLSERLCDGLVERLQRETDPVRRATIFGFPTQLSSLEGGLIEFFDEVFAPSKAQQPALVRGVYFTSGTQEGSPIDRMMGTLSRTFGLDRAMVAPRAGSGKSFFLLRLVREVVFPEKNLAGLNLAQERRRHLLRAAGIAGMLLAASAVVAAWGYSFVRNKDYLAAVSQQVAKLEETRKSFVAGAGSPLPAIAERLQAVRDVWITPQNPEGSVPTSMTFGLYQGDKLDAAALAVDQQLVASVMMPEVARRLESILRTSRSDNLELTYEALKAYLMLATPERYDPEALKAWITLDWERNLLDRGVNDATRTAMFKQLDVLLAQGPVRSSAVIDQQLIQSVRALLASYSLEQRIYSRLKRMQFAGDVQAFSVAAAAGPSAPLVLQRASGKPLTEGVSGTFTKAGYSRRFQIELEKVTTVLLAEEPWVLGLNANAAKGLASQGAVTDRVRTLYLGEYAKQWEELLADVRIVRGDSIEKNIQIARILSGADSPLAQFLRAVVNEVTLVTPEAQKTVVDKAAESVNRTRKSLEAVLGSPTQVAPVAAGKPIESLVDDRFIALRRLVQGAGSGPAPLDDALKLFNDVYVHLNAVDTAVKARSTPPPAEAANRIKAEAARLPEPMRSMLETISQTGNAQAQGAQRANLSMDLGPVSGFCTSAVAGRYPLTANATREVLPEDFGELFGPGGKMDLFFQQRLSTLVDTGVTPWRYRPQGEGAALSAPALREFERANRIKEVFFRGGARTPGLRLDFRPVEMDAGITQFILDVDGQLVKYAHGPVVPTSVQWPGQRGSGQVRLQVSPASPNGESGFVIDGPWALYRLFDRITVEPGSGPEKFFATFTLDSRKAKFEVTANSVQNPFRLRELREFTCPERL
jgi:type VI secretion system protein ImpL